MAVVTNPTIDSKTRGIIMRIVEQIKSEGVFDRFRRECLEELDSKEPYRQLKQRVESHVAAFLSKQLYSPNLPKNQLRNSLRTNISQSEVLSKGVDRLLEEVLSEKSGSFYTEIGDLVHDYLTSIGHYGKREKEKGQKLENQKVEKEKQQKMEISKLDREIDEFIKQETNRIIEANSGEKSKETEANTVCETADSTSVPFLLSEGQYVPQESDNTNVCDVPESPVPQDAECFNAGHTLASGTSGVNCEDKTVILDKNKIQETSISMNAGILPETPGAEAGSVSLGPDSVLADVQPSGTEFTESQVASVDIPHSMNEDTQLEVKTKDVKGEGNEIGERHVVEGQSTIGITEAGRIPPLDGGFAHAQCIDTNDGEPALQRKETSIEDDISDSPQPSTSKLDNQSIDTKKEALTTILPDAIAIPQSLPTPASEMLSQGNILDSQQITPELNLGLSTEYTNVDRKLDPAQLNTKDAKSCGDNKQTEASSLAQNVQHKTMSFQGTSIVDTSVKDTSLSHLSPESSKETELIDCVDSKPPKKEHSLAKSDLLKYSGQSSKKIKTDKLPTSKPAKKQVSNESQNQSIQMKTTPILDTKYIEISKVLPSETETVTTKDNKHAVSSEIAKIVPGKIGKEKENKQGTSSEKAKSVSGKDGKAVALPKETKLVTAKENKQVVFSEKSKSFSERDGNAAVLSKESKLVSAKYAISSEKSKSVSGKDSKAVASPKESKLATAKGNKHAISSEKSRSVSGKDSNVVVLPEESKSVTAKSLTEESKTIFPVSKSVSGKIGKADVLPREPKSVADKKSKQGNSLEKAKSVSGKDGKPVSLPKEIKLFTAKENKQAKEAVGKSVVSKDISSKRSKDGVSKGTKVLSKAGEKRPEKETEGEEPGAKRSNKEKIRSADVKTKRSSKNEGSLSKADLPSLGETVMRQSENADDVELSDSDITVSSVHTSDLSSLEDSDMEYEDYKAMRLKEKQAKTSAGATTAGSNRMIEYDNEPKDYNDENDTNDMSGSDFGQRKPSESARKVHVLSSSEATTCQTDTDSDVLPQRRSSRVASTKIVEDDVSQRTTPEYMTGDESACKNSRRKRSANEMTQLDDSETQKVTSDSTECDEDGRRQSKRSRRKIRPTKCYSPSENF